MDKIFSQLSFKLAECSERCASRRPAQLEAVFLVLWHHCVRSHTRLCAHPNLHKVIIIWQFLWSRFQHRVLYVWQVIMCHYLRLSLFFFYIMRATDYINGKSEHTRIWKPRFLKMRIEVHFVNLTHLSFSSWAFCIRPSRLNLFYFAISSFLCLILLTLKKKKGESNLKTEESTQTKKYSKSSSETLG